MAIRITWNNAVSGAPDYDEQDLRNLLNSFMSTGDASVSTGVRGGVLRSNGEDLEVTTPGDYSFDVKPGRAVIPCTAAAEGAFTVFVDAPESHPIEQAADSTLSRIDAVYVRALSPTLGDSTTGGEIGIVYGNTASVPSPPAIPANSLLLAEIEVPPSGSAVTINRDARKWLAGPGGVVVAPSAAGLENYLQESAPGTLAVTTSPYRLYVRNNTDWQVIVDPQEGSWQDLELNPNYTVQQETPQIKRVGDYVQCRGNFQRTEGKISLNGTATLVSIPSALSDYAPNGRRFFILPASSTVNFSVKGILNPDGTFEFQGPEDPEWPQYIDLSPVGYYI